MRKYPNSFSVVTAAAIILIGIFLRIAGMGFISIDMRDFVIRWYDQLALQGFSAMQTGFSNYTPPYLYLLWIATWIRTILPAVTAIKLISILFDLGCAFWVYKISRIKYREGPVPYLYAAIFFILPTILLNSAWWGQADSVYTFFVLASLFFVLKDHPLPAILFFGIAVSFKLQAVFFLPFLFLLAFKHRIRWLYFLIIPFVYIAMMIPAILAGRPLLDTLTIYLSQVDTFHLLTMNAPNLYQFVSNRFYEPVVKIGLGFSASFALVWMIYSARKIKTWKPELMVVCAAVSALMMPFFLPKMHERFFFIADVMILLLVIFIPRLWFVLLMSQLISTITYSNFLFSHGSPNPPPISSGFPLILFAALLNSLLVVFLFWEQHRLIENAPLSKTFL